jgi:hypothetical protein
MGNAISASAELGTQAQASAGNNLGRKSGLTVGGPKVGDGWKALGVLSDKHAACGIWPDR